MERNETNKFTYCIVIRYSSINFWIYERLKFIFNFYSPKPEILVLDLGSQWPYSGRISCLCNKFNIKYTYYNYNDIFSLSLGRNLCINHVKNKFIFFCDVDYIFNIDFVKNINKIILYKFNNELNTVSSFPIIHLSKNETIKFFKLRNRIEQDKLLYNIASISPYVDFGREIEFFTLYSNAILVSVDTFRVTGGYNLNFKGYGSEDFEYMINQSLLFNNIPLPKRFLLDKSPIKLCYYNYNYTGFRAYLEYIFFYNLNSGIRCFHLYHDKPKELGYWTKFNDKKKQNLFKSLNLCLNPSYLIKRDFINKKECLYLYVNEVELSLSIYYRILGYKVNPYKITNNYSLKKIQTIIEENCYYSIIIPFSLYSNMPISSFLNKDLIFQDCIIDNIYYIRNSKFSLDTFFAREFLAPQKDYLCKKLIIQLDKKNLSKNIKNIISRLNINTEIIFFIKSYKNNHLFKFDRFSILVHSKNSPLLNYRPDLIIIENDYSLILFCKQNNIHLSYLPFLIRLTKISNSSLSRICFSVDLVFNKLIDTSIEVSSDNQYKLKKFFINGLLNKPYYINNLPFSSKSYISSIFGINKKNVIKYKLVNFLKGIYKIIVN